MLGPGPPGERTASAMATSPIPTQRGFLGRQRELDVVQAALAATRDDGAVLVVRGDAGVGKSALLEQAVQQATEADRLVLRTDGTPTERRLPLAGLHKLLRPVLEDAVALPRPRREMLQGAFGATEAAVDVFG